MEYIVVKFRFEEGRATHNDILIARLSIIGYEAFEEHFDGIDAYITRDKFEENQLTKLSKDLSSEMEYSCEWKSLENKNWNEEWEANYNCMEINKELLIRSSFYNTEKNYTYEVVIDPRMAFGTGHHETTRMMLEEILAMDLHEKKVLDVGCGTGILSIVASLKGAKSIDAIDIDENAFQNTVENLRVNSIDNVSVQKGVVDSVKGKFDLILANINRNILFQDLEKYKKLLSSQGTILISGFYEKDITLFENLMNSLMLKKCKEVVDNEWSLLHIKEI